MLNTMGSKGKSEAAPGRRALVSVQHKALQILGDLQKDVPPKQGEQIAEAVQALKEHAEELRHFDEALENQTHILRSILNSIPTGVVVASKTGEYLLINPAAAPYTNITQEAKRDRPEPYGVFMLDTTTPYPAEEMPLARAIRGEAATKIELFVRHESFPAGRWLLCDAVPLTADNGAVRGGIAVYNDITERKKAAQALARRAEALARSNQELEQFAYVASHDLQEPLRMVASYVQLLELKYSKKMGEEADQYIAYIVDGAKRMHDLIQDLLAFSRAGKGNMTFVPVHCDAVVQAALENLKKAIDDSKANVTVDKLPIITGDPSQLRQLFQNLVENAIKYRGDACPDIHISAEKQRSEWVIQVRDNGIGMDPAYTKQIFRIFQRLHEDRQQYSGSGIGLAIAKKIVERHGGRIWCTSVPGEGSTFAFAMPTFGQ
jgi:PAS domain S-box-containing protein